MKKLILIAFVIALVWYFRGVDHEKPKPTPQAPISERSPRQEPRALAPKTESVQAPEPQTTPPLPATTNERPKPPPGTIPFERKGDFVIAFGDVLIGKPTRPDFPERGFIPIPRYQGWKGNEIAFAVHQDLPNPERVMRVIEYFNTHTPIRFVPLKDHPDSIVFAPTDIELCLSFVGRVGGHQPIYLNYRCDEREITHEIMHALGFVHEHSRPDRDFFVRVNWQNIEADKQSQFEVVPEQLVAAYKDRPFDYNSITMYDESDFARIRGQITLESLTEQKIAPVSHGLSAEDLNRLMLIYGR